MDPTTSVDRRLHGLDRRLLALDRRLLALMRTRGHSRLLDRLAISLSRFGQHGLGWLALGTAGALTDRPRSLLWRRAVLIVGFSYGANQAIKFTVRRRRPQLPGLPPLTSTVSQLSFPSAHSTTAFAAVQAYRGVLPLPLLLVAAALIALSRPYLGVHWPSDVAAGIALGSGIGAIGRRLAWR